MAVTLYVWDEAKRIRRILPYGVSKLIHKEEAYELTAEIPQEVGARPGEYLGFKCVDGVYRLFVIDDQETDAQMGVDILTATDEAAAELADTVTQNVKLEQATAVQAAEKAIAGTGWTIGKRADGRKADFGAEAMTTLKLLEEIAEQCDVRITPRFEFQDNKITARIIDIEEKRPVYRGRIFEGETDAGSITITSNGRPKTAAYGYGAVIGEEDPPQCVTIADAVWSKAAGDPADKPAGQAWIGIPEEIEKRGRREMIFRDEGEKDAQALLKKTWEALLEKSQPEAGGTAALSDLEDVQPHKAVRLFDEVAVKARNGETFRASVIGISRDYVRRSRTKITIGKEKKNNPKSLAQRVGRLERDTGTARRSGAAGKNKIIHNDTLIQLNAEAIQMNAKTILAQAEQIALKASKEEVTEQGKLITQAGIDIDGIRADLLLKANAQELNELAETLTEAYVDIDGLRAQILLKASKTVVDEQGERIKAAEIAIDGANSAIAMKADKIQLEGLVTASQLKAEITALKTAFAANMSVTNLDVGNLTFKGYGIGFQHASVLTDVTLRVNKSQSLNVQLGNGGTATVKYVTSVYIDKTYSDVYYLKYA